MIDVGAQDDGAQRAHQIARPKSHEGQHQRSVFVLRGKERATDGRGVIAEDHEIVHLEEISHRDTDDRADLLSMTHEASPPLQLKEVLNRELQDSRIERTLDLAEVLVIESRDRISWIHMVRQIEAL